MPVHIMSDITPYAIRGEIAPHETPVSPPEQRGDVHDLARIWSALRKRWRLFSAIAGGLVLIVLVATLVTPKSYTTTVRLMAGRPSTTDSVVRDNETALPILNALVLQNGEQSAETFAQLAQQRGLANGVISSLHLATTPSRLLARVHVKPVVNTALLNLSISWSSPEQSARISNAFAQAFVDQEREFVRAEAVAAIGYLENELPAAQDRMRESAAKLARFQSAHGYADASQREADIAGRMASIDQRIDQLTVDASEANALLNSANGQLAHVSSTVEAATDVAPNPVAADLHAKLADVETQLTAAEQQYTPAHPAVIALRQQRDALRSQIASQPGSIVNRTSTAPNPLYQSLQQQVSTYRARIDGDRAQLKTLRSEKSAYRPAAQGLPAEAVQFDTLRDDAKRASNVYNALAQKYNDAVVAKTTAISDILIVQPASADAAVVSPNLLINLAIAIVAGTLLGLAVVYILELLERRAADDELARLLGLPVVARIPAFDTTNPRMLPWIQSMTVEAFLHLCVTLRLRNRHALRSLAILSPCRGDGKSTVAFHLAKSMATLQPRILLVDADMRRPTLHEKARCENGTGLSDVLAGTVDLADAVREIAPSLDLLTSGTQGANPVVLLETYFEEMLERARETYAMVIVDAPAFTAVTDGLLIANRVEGSLLVVAAKSTDEREARNTVAQMSLLGINNVLGIVVNRETPKVSDYADYFVRTQDQLTSGRA